MKEQLNIYSIVKPTNDEFDTLAKEFIKMSSKYAKVQTHYIFNKKIAKAQTVSDVDAKKSYTEAFLPNIKSGSYNIALDVLGKKVDSFKFANFLDKSAEVNFFIGGAFGFEREFLNKCDAIISLSDLTMAHKVAHVVLLEQIFRGLCIKNNHPYHK